MGLLTRISEAVRRFTQPPKPRKVKVSRGPRRATRAQEARLPWVTGHDEYGKMRGKVMRIEGDQVELQTDTGNLEWVKASTIRPRPALAKSRAILRPTKGKR